MSHFSQWRGLVLSLVCLWRCSQAADAVPPAEDPTEEGIIQRYFSDQGSPLEYFRQHVKPYEPIYFIWMSSASPTSKFQYSLRYSLFNPEGSWASEHKWMRGPHLAFTQTSLWDLGGSTSSPFFDSSYKPEFFYLWENLGHEHLPAWFHVNLQGGYQHESNGKSPPDSRSANILYFQPGVIIGLTNKFHVIVAPRFFTYVADMSDNPDLPRYRGYMGGRVTFTYPKWPQLSADYRVGQNYDRGSLQLDGTIPLSKLTKSNMNLYLHIQYFNGWGESLLRYYERETQFRVGFALTR